VDLIAALPALQAENEEWRALHVRIEDRRPRDVRIYSLWRHDNTMS
jgi:hypothetical protein